MSCQAEATFPVPNVTQSHSRSSDGPPSPQDTLKREADRYYITHVKPGKAFGELDHPDSNSAMFRSLDGTNVSHQAG